MENGMYTEHDVNMQIDFKMTYASCENPWKLCVSWTYIRDWAFLKTHVPQKKNDGFPVTIVVMVIHDFLDTSMTYPLVKVYISAWTITMPLMRKLTVSMAMFQFTNC